MIRKIFRLTISIKIILLVFDIKFKLEFKVYREIYIPEKKIVIQKYVFFHNDTKKIFKKYILIKCLDCLDFVGNLF